MASEPVADLIQSFTTGTMSRRQFVLRLSALGLSMTSISAIVAACSSSPAATAAGSGGGQSGASGSPWAADPKSLGGTINLYKGPFAATEAQLQQPYIDSFKSVCPNVTVNFSTFDWTQATAQMTAALQSGSQDVIYIPEVFYGAFPYQGGPLEDLEPWIEDPAFKTLTANFLPGYLKRPKPSVATGILGGVAWIDGAQAMVYINLDLFQKAGIDPAKFNTSYDTMTAAAVAVQALGLPGAYGLGMRENGTKNFGQFEWYGYMLRAGTDFLTADGTAPAINTPEFVAALQMIQDWHVKQKVTPEFGKYDWAGIRGQFIAGNIGILLDEPEFTGVIASNKPSVPFKWDVAKYPPGPKADVMLGNAGLWVMSAKSQNKQAAWEVIKHWTEPNATYDQATGVDPIISDWKEAGFWKDNPIGQEIQNLLQYTHGPILSPKLQQMFSILMPFMDQIYAGTMAPADGLAQASTQIQAIL
jgi:ABC-type glycerol-3-phosphate transport system substrate-binding protein